MAGPSVVCSTRGSPRPLPLNSCSARNHGVSWTWLRKAGRRVQAPSKTRCSTSWTWEQKSIHWVSYHGRICSRPRNVNSGCITEEQNLDSFHREIKCSYCSHHLAPNCSPSGKGPLWSHSEWGMSTMRWCVLTGVGPHKSTTSTSLKHGGDGCLSG